MKTTCRILLGVCGFIGISGLQLVHGQQQVSQLLWQLGIEDLSQGEFSSEQTSNDPPGSAEAQDDDFYFAGTYPDPIGVVSEREPWVNYDRALTPGDPRNRIHFNLDQNSANPDTDLKVTVQMGLLGAIEGVVSTHDLVFRFNGYDFYSTYEVTSDLRVEETFKASMVGAVVGENILELERIGGSGSSWIQFDFVRLEIPASDTDGDGLPDTYEKLYPAFLNANDNTDAAKDQDDDGLTNLEEFTAQTDPAKPDSDSDGLMDGTEVKTSLTDPLVKDTDRDGLTDGEEVNQYSTNPNNPDSDGDSLSDADEIKVTLTNPNLADTDGDTYSDALEVKLGSDPNDPASTCVPFTQLWLLGLIDNFQAEFSNEVNGSPEAPGSPEALDDDFYFAGVYPDPIGEVAVTEDFLNFERALTSGNTFSRIHFNLSADQVKTNSEYLLTFNLIGLGSGGGPSLHDISFRLNGIEFHTETELGNAKKIEETIKAADFQAVAGENIIELERIGGTGSSWIQFDYVEMSYRDVTADPNADADGDLMTDVHEGLAGTDPKDPKSNLRVISVLPGATSVEITWSSVAGKKYVLEYSPALAKGSWQTIATCDSAGATTSYSDTDSGRRQAATGYYRIRLSN